jgi:hypothetical protein
MTTTPYEPVNSLTAARGRQIIEKLLRIGDALSDDHLATIAGLALGNLSQHRAAGILRDLATRTEAFAYIAELQQIGAQS